MHTAKLSPIGQVFTTTGLTVPTGPRGLEIQDFRSEKNRNRGRIREVGLGFLLVAIHLGFLRLGTLTGYLTLILAACALLGMAYLLVLALLGASASLRQFWTSRKVDPQLQNRLLREVIAARAKTQGQDPNR